MAREDSNQNDAVTLALRAVLWICQDEARATRLLSLTGLAPDDLRGRLGDLDVLAAALSFLESHEPDLVACADALETTPAALVRARTALENDR
jgi:hypothetical protein